METPPVNTQALPAGTRIEDFVIERVLGAGGFGMTYLARDTRLGRQVVIKENFPAQYCFRDTGSLSVAPRHTHESDADNFQWSLDNFNREAGMLASLDHPGIVRVLGSFEAFCTAYLLCLSSRARRLTNWHAVAQAPPLHRMSLSVCWSDCSMRCLIFTGTASYIVISNPVTSS
jgi:hypothetical protein